jgi:DNA polymerase III subunit gamma/tau
MKQALYRRNRPRSFKDVVGQDHITSTLKQAIKSGRISHAYLFTGPRGVGKTSVARILAHEVNGFPYETDSLHLDIIEIDAASNRRIDEIRDLREKVHTAPAAGKYKVYIIDEVHMLTREAFNALLKTLEEPPAHIIFILATTEAHKLPETIISRTQRFEFKPVTGSKVEAHLMDIAKQEGIKISPEAVKLLAEFGGGSFRDSISYLDQLSSSSSTISEEDVRQVLGMPSARTIKSLADQVHNHDTRAVLDTIQSLKDQGIDASLLAAALAKELRNRVKTDGSNSSYIKLLKDLINVPGSASPYDYLELAALEAASDGAQDPPAAKATRSAAAFTAKITTQKPLASPAKTLTNEFSVELWPSVLDSAKNKAASIYTALKLAEPSYSDHMLTLKFQFPLHQKKVEQAKNKILVADLIEELCGTKIKVECVVDKDAFHKQPDERPYKHVSKSAPLHTINNVFGAAELLES